MVSRPWVTFTNACELGLGRWALYEPRCEISTVDSKHYTSRYECFKMIGLHPFCAALFALGYALREVGAYNYSWQTDVEGEINNTNLIIYVLSQIFVYIAP